MNGTDEVSEVEDGFILLNDLLLGLALLRLGLQPHLRFALNRMIKVNEVP